MIGRTKATGEDCFEVEEKLRSELETTRRQSEETAAKLAELDVQYRLAASAALSSGDEETALRLRGERERLEIRRDGLLQRAADLEPKSKEATQRAQAARLSQAEQARRDRLAALIAQGKEAAEAVRAGFEIFMRSLSNFDDVRQRLAAPEFGNEGMHEIEMLGNSVPQVGPASLRGRLLAAGWRERTGIRGSYFEMFALQAPPK
jgi:hypothetical protein